MSFLERLLNTNSSLAGTILRIGLGIVILPHGLQKTVGWFSGHGFSGTLSFFTETLGLPWIVALLVILGESLGALSLIVGFLTRFCAASIGLIMIGAVQMSHLKNGFFMNWSGNQAGEGFEYHLLAISIAAALIVVGGGRWSIDSLLQRRVTASANAPLE